MRIFTTAVALTLTALSLSAQTDTPAPGFQLGTPSSPPVPFAAYATLSDGNRVTWDGQFCDLYDATGSLLLNLGSTGAGFAFSSFIAVDPTETFAIVGESSNSGIFKVDLAGGGLTSLTSIVFNFDAVFDSANSVVVSAAQCGFNCGSDFVRIDTDTGDVELLGHVPGPSGPMAINSKGEIFYYVQSQAFPTPPGSITLVKWTADQLVRDGMTDLTWTVVAARRDAGTSIAIDPANDHIYTAESVFNRAHNYIYEFDADGVPVGQVVEVDRNWVTNLEMIGDSDELAMRRFRGETGNRLSYQSTNFGAIDLVQTIEPQRAQLTMSGLGATGSGMFHLNVTGAMPGGKVQFWMDAQSLLLGGERTLPLDVDRTLGTEDLVSLTSNLSKRALVSALTGTNSFNFFGLTAMADENGNATVSFFNNGRLNGEFAYQAYVLNPALIPFGTTNTILH